MGFPILIIMKPTKNKVFCRDCERFKMLFETEKKANLFIKFNEEEIIAESGYAPQRSYYCIFCAGWHVTSRKENTGLSRNEQILEQYLLDKKKDEETKILKEQEKRNEIIKELENKIKDLDSNKKEIFFSEYNIAKEKEIQKLLYSKSKKAKAKLKEIRQILEIYNNYRIQNEIKLNCMD